MNNEKISLKFVNDQCITCDFCSQYKNPTTIFKKDSRKLYLCNSCLKDVFIMTKRFYEKQNKSLVYKCRECLMEFSIEFVENQVKSRLCTNCGTKLDKIISKSGD